MNIAERHADLCRRLEVAAYPAGTVHCYQTAGPRMPEDWRIEAQRAAERHIARSLYTADAAARAWCAYAELPGALVWQQASDIANAVAITFDPFVVVEIECPGVDL